MRVAFYQGTFQLGQDGTTTTLYKMVQSLERAQIAHVVHTPLPPEPGVSCATPVVPMSGFRFPLYPDYSVALPSPKTLAAHLDAFRPDVLHIGTPDLGGLAFLRHGLRRGLPIVGAYHTHFLSYLPYYTWFPGLAGAAIRRYFRYFYRRCDRVLVPTRPIMQDLAAIGIERMELWPRGVDTSLFSPAFSDAGYRRQLGSPDRVLFTYCGRLVLEKNVLLLARAYRRLLHAMPDAQLAFIGDGPARAELERLVPDALFLGYLTGRELARAYASSDVFVFPSITETFGNVVLEAMASGLPVIGVNRGGVAGVVKGGQTGLLVEEDEEALAGAMRRLAVDRQERVRLAQNALTYAQEQSWDAVFDRQFEVYDELVGEKGALNVRRDNKERARTAEG